MTTTIEKTPAEQLSAAIMEAHAADLLAQVRTPSTQPYFYLSGIHSCARHLFYQITAGDKRPAVDLYTQGLFESGMEWEAWVKRKLLKWGLELLRAGEEVLIKYAGRLKVHHGELMGKGKVDGIFKFLGAEIPAEIKSMDGNMFKRLETVDDLLNYEHTEKYVKQLLMYLYGKNREWGVFILTDCRGHLKVIVVFLGNHLELAERALRDMEKAWEAKIEGAEPDRIAYHSKICGRCAFSPICLPEQVVGGADAIDDPELEALLLRHEEIKPIAAEYDDLHDSVKDRFKGKPRTTVSQHFEVTCAVQTQKKVDTTQLDAETLARITTKGEKHVVKVKDLLKSA